MKTQIVIKFSIEGLHSWPGIIHHEELAEKVGFLQFPHRHLFFIKAVKSVTHADRDIEIIDFKRIMIHYLYQKYGKAPTAIAKIPASHCDFGPQSCEMIAAELFKKFELDSCEVLEDNENGGIVSNEEPTPIEAHTMKQPDKELEIIDKDRIDKGENMTFVCGFLCSGKSFYAKAVAAAEQTKGPVVVQMEVSDIVRAILKEEDREKLQGHPELDKQIIFSIDNLRYMNKGNEIVISGARQTSILIAFPKATCIWIDVPESVRYNRFKLSQKDKDTSLLGFTKANERDVELGIEELKHYILNRNK